MRGEVSFQLTVWEVLSLAVNVVQNGRDHAELPLESLRHDLKRRGLPGGVGAAWRDETLRQVHREILRANRESQHSSSVRLFKRQLSKQVSIRVTWAGVQKATITVKKREAS